MCDFKDWQVSRNPSAGFREGLDHPCLSGKGKSRGLLPLPARLSAFSQGGTQKRSSPFLHPAPPGALLAFSITGRLLSSPCQLALSTGAEGAQQPIGQPGSLGILHQSP